MNSALTLHSGVLRCELSPALGGCVAGLWYDDRPVLRSTPAAALQSPRVSASYPLIPYSNRIGYGQLQWQGRQTELPKNFAPEPHAIHGVGWERAWAVLEATATSAVLTYAHQADAAWPMGFEATQWITLTDHALELRMAITNRAPHAAPVGLGWHPYFSKTPASHVAFKAQGRWEMAPDKLPTERLAHAGLHTDCSSLQVDHCFDGWDGVLDLTEGGLRMRVTSNLDRLVVFTTPGRDNIAIEPVSHVNNALALAANTGVSPESLGIRVLQPGETFEATMCIEVELTA